MPDNTSEFDLPLKQMKIIIHIQRLILYLKHILFIILNTSFTKNIQNEYNQKKYTLYI